MGWGSVRQLEAQARQGQLREKGAGHLCVQRLKRGAWCGWRGRLGRKCLRGTGREALSLGCHAPGQGASPGPPASLPSCPRTTASEKPSFNSSPFPACPHPHCHTGPVLLRGMDGKPGLLYELRVNLSLLQKIKEPGGQGIRFTSISLGLSSVLLSRASGQ